MEAIRTIATKAWMVGPIAVEKEFAEKLAIPHAIFLPSARAGMAWGLEAICGIGKRVVVPAFTCPAVHESVGRVCAHPVVVDSEADFLMNRAILADRLRDADAVILSEVFGQAYDLTDPVFTNAPTKLFRILDMAMTIPERSGVSRLVGQDLALFSFGVGKIMYSGWGGVAVTHDGDLAERLRRVRKERMQSRSMFLGMRRALMVILRAAAARRYIYKSARSFALWRQTSDSGENILSAGKQRKSFGDEGRNLPISRGQAAEWFMPGTSIDHKITLRNISNCLEWVTRRRSLEFEYRSILGGSGGIVVPPVSSCSLSHFSVRVAAEQRDRVRRFLWERKVDTGILFQQSPYIDPGSFPFTERLSAEVVNLPMSHSMNRGEVQYVSRTLLEALQS